MKYPDNHDGISMIKGKKNLTDELSQRLLLMPATRWWQDCGCNGVSILVGDYALAAPNPLGLSSGAPRGMVSTTRSLTWINCARVKL